MENVPVMFVSPAYAQAAGGGPAGFDLFSLLPLILIFVVFWFLLIRPQQKKMKQHREMIAAIRRGDRVLTGGGIIGTVSKVLNDTEVQVEIAEGVRVKVARSTISEVLAKTEPAKGRSAAEEDEEEDVEEAEEASGTKGRSAKG
jgi:preprotein translocase subunit YajC